MELTVCMLVYNGEETIAEAIRSVLSQTYRDFKLLIYNDGSTDGTLDVIASFHDDRIHVVDGRVNKGIYYARAKAIETIDTKYAMWIDDDDYFCRDDAFEEAMTAIKSGDYDLVNFVPRMYKSSDGCEFCFTSRTVYKGDFEYCGDSLFEKVFPVDEYVWFPCKIFKTELLRKSIPEDEILERRVFGDDCFFAPMWYFHARRYLHKVDCRPMYCYRCDIGLWGANRKKKDTGFYLKLIDLRYSVLLSCHRRMSGVRKLTEREERNLVEGDGFSMYNLMNLCRKFMEMRNSGDKDADVLIESWKKRFCADGVHILNGYDGYALPDYARMLNNLLK